MNRVQAVKLLREAADVQRCHTIRTHGEYSVGHHTFNMLSMLRLLNPEAPRGLIWAILEHDIPERFVGDIPATAKWAGVVNHDVLSDIESRVNEAIFEKDYASFLSAEDHSWLKSLDILELWMFGKDQVSMGNTTFLTMIYRIEQFISKNAHQFPSEVLDFYYEVRSSPWIRGPELSDEGFLDVR